MRPNTFELNGRKAKGVEKSVQLAKMNTGITGQKTRILKTDENSDATWHHWAEKG
jgi:hypothetical protein